MPRNTSRRDFLKVSLGALPAISLGGTVPLLIPRLAFADGDTPGTRISKDNILVVLQLSGGNDGLNTLIPKGNDDYDKARPAIKITDGLHMLDDGYGLHPDMTAFKALWDEGHLAVIPGCGYPRPNRSHFESMDIWHAADTTGGTGSGWLGHYLDHLVRGTRAASIANNPLAAINVGRELPMALVSPELSVPSVQSLDDFGLSFQQQSAYDIPLEREILVDLQHMARDDANPQQAFFARQAADAIISVDEIRRVAGQYQADATYEGGVGNRLRLIAQLISGDFGTRVFYAETGGYDTHADQVQSHGNLLKGVADNVRAFFADLKAKGIDDKVTLMVFSEFGRRITQNGNNGTDHGAAGPMFVVGPNVQGGFHADHPLLSDPGDDDLKYTMDFRRVYNGLLRDWLNVDPATVIPGDFEPLSLLRTSAGHVEPTTRPA